MSAFIHGTNRKLCGLARANFPLAGRQCCYKLERFAGQAILGARSRLAARQWRGYRSVRRS